MAGCDWGLLGCRFTVQVVMSQGLHRTHPLPNPSLHLMLIDGQIQVLSLERKDATWHTARPVCNIYTACVDLKAALIPGAWASTLGSFLKQCRAGFIQCTHLDRDNAARFVVVRFAGVVPVQWVELRVGLITEGFTPHSAEVKMEAVHQEVNFDPGPPGLWTHCRSGTWDEGGAVHCAPRLILDESKEQWNKYRNENDNFCLGTIFSGWFQSVQLFKWGDCSRCRTISMKQSRSD